MGITKPTMAQRHAVVAKEYVYAIAAPLLIFAICFAAATRTLLVPAEFLAVMLLIIPVGICAAIAIVSFATSSFGKDV